MQHISTAISYTREKFYIRGHWSISYKTFVIVCTVYCGNVCMATVSTIVAYIAATVYYECKRLYVRDPKVSRQS